MLACPLTLRLDSSGESGTAKGNSSGMRCTSLTTQLPEYRTIVLPAASLAVLPSLELTSILWRSGTVNGPFS